MTHTKKGDIPMFKEFEETVEKAKTAGLIRNDGDLFRIELDQLKAIEGMDGGSIRKFLCGRGILLRQKISSGDYSIEYREDIGDESLPYKLKRGILKVDGVPIVEHVIYAGTRMLNNVADPYAIDNSVFEKLRAATWEPSMIEDVVCDESENLVALEKWIDEMKEALY